MDLLAKDCDCRTHDGPHWLHMDHLWHERNRTLLQDASRLAEHGEHMGAILLMEAFCAQELARLREKKYQMRLRGLTEIPEGKEAPHQDDHLQGLRSRDQVAPNRSRQADAGGPRLGDSALRTAGSCADTGLTGRHARKRSGSDGKARIGHEVLLQQTRTSLRKRWHQPRPDMEHLLSHADRVPSETQDDADSASPRRSAG